MDQARPPQSVPDRQPALRLPGTVEVGGRPAVRARLHLDAFGSEREQLGRCRLCILEHLHEGVAVQEHMPGNRLQKRRRDQPHRVPGACRNLARLLVKLVDARRSNRFGHQPDGSLCHRIADKGVPDLRFIAARPITRPRSRSPCAHQDGPGFIPALGLPAEPPSHALILPAHTRTWLRSGFPAGAPSWPSHEPQRQKEKGRRSHLPRPVRISYTS